MANNPPKVRNGPKSIKAISRGMGIGMSMLPNQPIQTTAIPQTPAVCTAAVKWKATINKPDSDPDSDKTPILKKDENEQQVEDNSKQWPDLVTKTDPQPGGGKPKNTKIDPSTGGGKPKNGKKSKGKAPSTSANPTVTKTEASPDKTPNTDRNSTARASLVSTELEKSPVHQPQPNRAIIQNVDKDEEGDKKQEVTRAENQLIAAIPVMPLSLAVLCMFLNIFAPGTGR